MAAYALLKFVYVSTCSMSEVVPIGEIASGILL